MRGFSAGDLENPDRYAQARRELANHDFDVEWETSAARSERYGGGRAFDEAPRPSRAEGAPAAPSGGWILGGPLVVSYDHVDVKFSPNGLMMYGDDKQWEIPLTMKEDGRDFRLNAFYDSIVDGKPMQCDARWGRATVEALLAIDQSGRERREIMLEHQVAYND